MVMVLKFKKENKVISRYFPIGFSPLDFTMKGGRRYSTYQAYILPSMHRRNLMIYRYAMATKVNLNILLVWSGLMFPVVPFSF